MNKIEPQFIGQLLLKRGFKDWFLYLFKVIEGRKFIVEPLHNELFDYFQSIYDGKIIRGCINICPRSGKTTLSEYFLVYLLTINPKSQVIYTSYSQSLLGEISNKVTSILENPIYKAMYPITITQEQEEFNPIDDFWRDYLHENTGKNTYSSKIIKTYASGICLFASCGSQITGYGAGMRNTNKFSGCLIMDDINKPADVKSLVMRDKVVRYYEETLLSRLNNSNVPIINIQQRLHIEDLSGILIKKYNFDVLKVPLIDNNGKCNIPSQYNDDRIKELQINNYMFQSQYQQEPILDGGNIIKRDWFNYYPIDDYNYKKIVMACDTAISIKEHSDYSALLVGGITQDNKLHILDLVHKKVEYPDLKKELVNLYNRWQFDKRHTSCSSIYIENKASGQQLIQELKKATNLPIVPIDVTKDKLTRIEEILDYIASGQIYLPVNENYGFNPIILNESAEFSRDMSHKHDDVVDSLVHLINNTIAKRKVSILEVL